MDNNLQVKTTPFDKAVFIFIALLNIPMHELGHLLGYSIDGISTRFYFNAVDTVDGSLGFWGPIGGPGIVMIVAIIATALLYLSNRKKDLWIFIANIMILNRLTPFVLISIFNPKNLIKNDEGLIASVLNLSMWQVYGFEFSFFLIVLLALYLKVRGDLKRHFNTYQFGYALFFVFLFVLGIRVK